MIRSNGGWDSFKIMIIKELNCNSKIELLIEEDKMMKELKSTLNMVRAHLTNEQYKVEQAVYDKQRNIIQHKCECGGCFNISHKHQHLKTKKHINYVATTNLVLTV